MSLTARPTQISGTTGRPRLRADLSRGPSSTAGRRARRLEARTPTRSFCPLPGPPSGDLPPPVRALFAARIFTRVLWPHVGDDREGLSPNLPTPAGACFGLMPRDLLGHLGYVVLALHDYPLPSTRGFPNRETIILRRSQRAAGEHPPPAGRAFETRSSRAYRQPCCPRTRKRNCPAPNSEAKSGSTLPRSRVSRTWGRTKSRSKAWSEASATKCRCLQDIRRVRLEGFEPPTPSLGKRESMRLLARRCACPERIRHR